MQKITRLKAAMRSLRAAKEKITYHEKKVEGLRAHVIRWEKEIEELRESMANVTCAGKAEKR